MRTEHWSIAKGPRCQGQSRFWANFDELMSYRSSFSAWKMT
jgi:hypothetical protein